MKEVFAAATTLAISCALFAAPVFPPLPDEAGEAWVQETLAALTLEERVGQLLMPAISAAADTSPDKFAEHLQLVRDVGAGSVTLRMRSAPRAIEMINALQAASDVPLLINVNFERGTGTFWPEGTILPRQMALAATGDPETARLAGEITAREARACGVHWVSVPICDVNINPENPIINIRSFGEDVETVSRFSAAFVEGCQSEGVMACAKHFPGHGDTATDSHLELAVVDVDRARLESVEFPPFQAAIDAGVATVMTSHIWFPALMEDEGQIPATESGHVLTDLLRGSMGFEGLVLTDSLAMHGISHRHGPGEAVLAAIAAGSDVLLDSPDNRLAHEAMVAAVRDGTLSEQRLNESVEHILRIKAGLGLHRGAQVDAEAALAALRAPESLETARDLMRRAITAVKDENQILPLGSAGDSSLLHIVLYDDWANWPADDLVPLEKGLRDRVAALSQEVLREGDLASRAAQITEMAAEADIILISAFVRTAAYRGRVGLGPQQLALTQDLAATSDSMILAVFGSPYLALATPEVPCILLTYDESRLAAEALPGALFGESPITGRLPVTLPGLAERGDGLQISE